MAFIISVPPPPVRRDLAAPAPADLARHVADLDLDEVWGFLNPQMLYGKHLGLKGAVARLEAEGDPKLAKLKHLIAELQEVGRQGALRARAVWRFFPAEAAGERVTLFDPESGDPAAVWDFPRQSRNGGLCLADYLLPGDHLAVFVTSAGSGVRDRTETWKREGEYLKSHAFAALALLAAAKVLRRRAQALAHALGRLRLLAGLGGRLSSLLLFFRLLGIELAADQLDLRDVRATGTAGRVMHADLDAHAKARPAAPAGSAPRAAAAAAAPPTPTGTRREGEQAIPVIGLRRKIALKMQDAKRRIPHFSYVEEVDVTELEALRAALNERHGAARGKLTLLPLLMRAIALAVVEHPEVNARFDDEKGVLTRHAAVHIGIATQTDVGLMVPVVRHAEALDLWGAAAEVARLAEAARAGNITRDELSGSTITITSLGPLGGIVTTPIINHPEVAIVGVNRIVERPVIRGGAVVARKLMNLSSSFDHRVVDGHTAALFVQALRALLENPALLFVD